MRIPQEPWQTKAEKKVAATKSKIPPKWILSHTDLKRAKERRQLSGPFIESFLDQGELEIIKLDSVPLVEQISIGRYTALQVTQAFCKTAAIAHQIVSSCFLAVYSAKHY
jgi:amidase